MYPFSESSFAPRNGWYVCAFKNEIGRELLSRWILNEPVVLYRKEDGTAVAVGGRCPHRHFPLGESKLVGDAIQCGYHGITFNAEGRCTLVPSQENIPNVYTIPNYPLVERGLWAWIWMGDRDRADPDLIPTVDEIGLTAPGYKARPFYSLEVQGRYQLLNDNLLDLSHLGYLHGTSIGTEENASTPEVREQDGRRLSSRRYMNGAACPDVITKATGHTGPIDRVSGMDFFLPGFHSGIDETRPAGGSETGAAPINEGKVWHAVTPSKRNTTLYFFAMGAPTEEKLDFMYDYLKAVVQEDVFATEEIEKILGTVDELPPELMLKSDATAVLGRRMLQRMMDLEAAEAQQS